MNNNYADRIPVFPDRHSAAPHFAAGKSYRRHRSTDHDPVDQCALTGGSNTELHSSSSFCVPTRHIRQIKINQKYTEPEQKIKEDYKIASRRIEFPRHT